MSYIVGCDVGGTCTDVVVIDEKGKITLGKAFSTPPEFSEGILNGARIAAENLGLTLDELLRQSSYFLHGSTIAENAVLGGTLAKGGLITTKGFEETLLSTRGGYGRWSGLTDEERNRPVRTDKLPPIIPLSMIRGVKERTDYKGEILINLDRSEVEEAIHELVNSGVEALGVCFLWSFENPENEFTVKDIIKELYPETFTSVSSEIAPLLGEYERTSTVALNVCLGPPVSGYLNSLVRNLAENGFQGTLLVMQAYGGLLPVEESTKRAVGTIESGPVSGLVGSQSIGAMIGVENIIATDMGGTTFKAGVINKGLIEYQKEPMVLRYHYLLPKMDIVSIGMAGGSIIWMDERLNVPRVGPRSAGASPGPVCYDFGGEEPTITDVDLILGYLDSRFFLGGTARLNKEKATRIFKTKIADPLNMEVTEAAAAIYKIANSMIYDLLHTITVEKGFDPRKYGLFAYGGSAGMHVGTYGEELKVAEIIVPNTASVHGAFGLVASDVVHEYQVAHRMRVPVHNTQVNSIFNDLRSKAISQLKSEGFQEERIMIQRFVDMRYGRQVHIITTPVEAPVSLSDSDLENIYNRFEELYEGRYGKGSAYREAGMELVAFRLRATALLTKPKLYKQELSGSNPKTAFIEKKRIYLEKAKDMVEVDTYVFEELLPGNEIKGPAIIYTPITTIVINPGQTAICDEYKNVRIHY